MKRPPTAAQLAALFACISIQALLWLGMRQAGRIDASGSPDDALLIVMPIADARHLRTPSPSPAGKRTSTPAHRKPHPRPERHAGEAVPLAASPAIQTVADDRWDHAADAAAMRVPITFEHSLAAPRGERSFAPASHLASLPFRDTTFAGVLADLAKREDCKALRYAIRNRRESAATVFATMLRRGCTP